MLCFDVLRTHFSLIFCQWQWIMLYGSKIGPLIFSLDYLLLKYGQGQDLNQYQKPLATVTFVVVQHMF